MNSAQLSLFSMTLNKQCCYFIYYTSARFINFYLKVRVKVTINWMFLVTQLVDYSQNMAQAQMEICFPDHEFLFWHKHDSLFIEGHCMTLNKTQIRKADNTKVSYFYCQRRQQLGCRKSARDVKGDDGLFHLIGYSGLHCEDCVPSSSYFAVRKIRKAIRERILADPTEKASKLYLEEVSKVRDDLGNYKKTT